MSARQAVNGRHPRKRVVELAGEGWTDEGAMGGAAD